MLVHLSRLVRGSPLTDLRRTPVPVGPCDRWALSYSRVQRMHSFGYRANALLTFAVTILALICAMASLSDHLNVPSPTAKVQVSLSFLEYLVGSLVTSLLFSSMSLSLKARVWSLSCRMEMVGTEHKLVPEAT